MKLKTIEFDSFKQSISNLIDEIANSIKESFDKSKSNIFKDMIADTKLFVDWAKDYNKVDDLLHQNIIVALNNLKNVSKEELESLDECELNEYFGIVNNVENIHQIFNQFHRKANITDSKKIQSSLLELIKTIRNGNLKIKIYLV